MLRWLVELASVANALEDLAQLTARLRTGSMIDQSSRTESSLRGWVESFTLSIQCVASPVPSDSSILFRSASISLSLKRTS